MHGDRAAELGCYDQAIFDYSQAIKLTPDNYNLYLDRSAAHLESGSIEQSLADYEEYNIRKPDSLESAYDFSKAFIRSLA
jgi:tetratricopeptide (TPR) repeat protein